MSDLPWPGPLAFLITFRSYGTWLPGDARGWVSRAHRLPDAPYLSRTPGLEQAARRLLQHRSPRLLAAPDRAIVSQAIQQVCGFHGHGLHAINVRSNHVHVVVAAQEPPERVMNAFKAWSTRRLVEAGQVSQETKVWARHGSTRYLWTRAALDAACRYVVEGQGPEPAP